MDLLPRLTLLSILALGLSPCAVESESASNEPAAKDVTPSPRPEIVFRTEDKQPGFIWVEGEAADRSTARRHNWYDGAVRKAELSGDAWISHFADQAAEAEYTVEVTESGNYDFWISGNPVANPEMDYRIDGGDLDESGNILIQASTTARPYGFEENPVTIEADGRSLNGFEITKLGSSPWNLEKNDIELRLTNDRVSRAIVLDANGYPIHEIPLQVDGDNRSLRFPESALYVILSI